MTVVPAEIFAWRLYALPAIAWAIALFGLDRGRSAKVRDFVCPDRIVAAGSQWRWRQLARWIDFFSDLLSTGTGCRRQRAKAIAFRIASRVGPQHAINSGAAWIGATMAIPS
jgi:hypothetical protein